MKFNRNAIIRKTDILLDNSKFIVLKNHKFLARNSRLVYLESLGIGTRIYLGVLGSHYFCCDLSDQLAGDPSSVSEGNTNAAGEDGMFKALNDVYNGLKPSTDSLEDCEFLDIRPHLFNLPSFDYDLLSQSISIANWIQNNRFCAGCGARNTVIEVILANESGYKLQCSNEACVSHKSVKNYSHPRTDAVVITCVESVDGNSILLAGFIEPGEALEDAVKREVYEETGVEVGPVEYHSSQTWPFPSQLMCGFISKATSTEINLIDQELQDAKWFSRKEVEDALNNKNEGLKLPPSYAIAHTLIRHWITMKSKL